MTRKHGGKVQPTKKKSVSSLKNGAEASLGVADDSVVSSALLSFELLASRNDVNDCVTFGRFG